MVKLLEVNEEQPKSKRLRYTISGITLLVLLSIGFWYFFLRFISEKRAVLHFMDDVVAEKFEDAYKIWKPQSSYTYDRFMGDWGVKGYYGPVKSYRIDIARAPSDSSGVVVVVEISPEPTLPAENDAKSIHTRSVALWVEKKDLSFSFPPSF